MQKRRERKRIIPPEPVTTRTLVAVIPPPAPLWCVFHEPEHAGIVDELFADPVVLLAVYEDRTTHHDGQPEAVATDVVPILLYDWFVEETGDTANFLGITDQPTIKRDDWQDEIEARSGKGGE